MWVRAVLVVLLLALGSARGWAAPGDEVAKIEACMRANLPETLQVREIELLARDKSGGERVMLGKLYAILQKDLIQAMVKIEAPADMRGAAYLVRETEKGGEEEKYVFIPALGKVRRITGGMKDSSLFGTDLSYADVKQIIYALSGGKVVLEKTETLESRPAWLLSMAPEPAQENRFDKVRAWIDQQSCMVVKAEFEQDKVVRKRFSSSAKNLVQSGTRWYLSEGLMEDLQEKSSTRLRIVGVTNDKQLPDRLFNPRVFYLSN
jgi:hypothetical protein